MPPCYSAQFPTEEKFQRQHCPYPPECRGGEKREERTPKGGETSDWLRPWVFFLPDICPTWGTRGQQPGNADKSLHGRPISDPTLTPLGKRRAQQDSKVNNISSPAMHPPKRHGLSSYPEQRPPSLHTLPQPGRQLGSLRRGIKPSLPSHLPSRTGVNCTSGHLGVHPLSTKHTLK